MEELYPQTESEVAAEGTRAAEVACLIARGLPPPPWATEEMITGGHLWAKAWAGHPQAHYEAKVTLNNENWGTTDGWDWVGDTLYVADYKFGHKVVEVFENWQLLDYALCIIGQEGRKPAWIELIIVQPRQFHRDGPIRRWRLSMDAMHDYADVILRTILSCLAPDSPTISGNECANCSARLHCHTFLTSVSNAYSSMGDTVPFDMPVEAQSKQLAMVQEAIRILKGMETGLSNEILARIKSGQRIPGWMTEQAWGRVNWKVGPERVAELGMMCGIKLDKPAVSTPKQAISAGVPEAMVNALSESRPGEIKLVRDTCTQARKAFGGNNA